MEIILQLCNGYVIQELHWINNNELSISKNVIDSLTCADARGADDSDSY